MTSPDTSSQDARDASGDASGDATRNPSREVSPESTQTQDAPTPVSSSATPAKQPTTDEGKRLMEQARDAVDNVRDGYGDEPIDVPPASEETFEESAQGGTEPTHVPSTGADRRS